MKTKGRIVCDELKRIRYEIAKANGIAYEPTECKFKGECQGTCPKCEAELAELTRKIKEMKNAKIVGIAPLAKIAIAAGMTLAVASCNNDMEGECGEPDFVRKDSVEISRTPNDFSQISKSNFEEL